MKTLSILGLTFIFVSFTTFKGQEMTKTELFFGLSKPDGQIISARDWQAFADTVIAKIFTDSSTLIDAHGQYLGENGKLIFESSKMLIIVSKLDSKHIDLVLSKKLGCVAFYRILSHFLTQNQ